MRTGEEGFTLVETMCALLVLSLALLLSARLWQAAAGQERQAEMQFAVSRRAVSIMEAWRMQAVVPPGVSEREFAVGTVSVHETATAAPDQGAMRLTAMYEWQERGRHFEQAWATYHR